MVKLVRWLLYKLIRENIDPFIVRNRTKIFCIGLNKTGTTSIKRTFEDLGYIVGNQRKAEALMEFYIKKDFAPIIKYCKSAQVFQDFPFSFPETFKYLDREFPGSKFILTIRDSPEQWYYSIRNFHSKVFGKGKVPSVQNLMEADYVYKGWAWSAYSSLVSDTDPLYDEMVLTKFYINYNSNVIDYFKDRSDDLLVINLADCESFELFKKFLNIEANVQGFPWENRTENVRTK